MDEIGDPAEGHHRPGQKPQIADEGNEIPRRDGEQNGLSAADQQNQNHAHVREEQHHREKGAGDPHQLKVFLQVGFRGLFHARGLRHLAVVGFDQADDDEALADDFRQMGERGLHRLVAAVHLAAENPRAHADQGHGDEDDGGEEGVDIGHESDGGGAHDQGVVQSHQSHAGRHADLLDVVGGVRHEVAGAGAVEVGGREGLKMAEKAVAQTLLDAAGGAEKAQPPHIPKQADQERHGGDGGGIDQHRAGFGA